MKKGTRMKKMQPIVEKILTNHPKTRDSDHLLYCFYLNSCGYSKNTSFYDICLMVQKGEIASMESIGRIRRKIQETTPALRGTEAVLEGRKRKEAECVSYARGV